MNIQPTAAPAPRADERMAGVIESSRTPAPASAPPGAINRADEAGATPASRSQLANAVKQINQALPASAQGLEFTVDDDSQQTIVKVIDRSTKEVLRQIPSTEAMEIAKSLDKMMGLLIKQQA